MKASGRAHRLTSLLAAATAALALALPAAAATREIVVEAPAPFKALLEKNLDVERAARLPEADSLDDNEWARLVAAVPAQGRALAETEGYFRADVTVAADPGDPHRLTIRLVPNEPATVGRLTIEFDGDLARKAEAGDPQAQAIEAQVRAGWKLKPGAILRNGDWTGDKAQALQALRAQGYAAAEWTATASPVDPSTNRARLFLVADSGWKYLSADIWDRDIDELEADMEAGHWG